MDLSHVILGWIEGKSIVMWLKKNILKEEKGKVSNQELEALKELEKRHPLEGCDQNLM